MRTEGFALFVAVCNQPAERDNVIAVLAESFPATGLEIIRIKADCADLLDCVLQQADPAHRGPLMLVDLERAISSSEQDHPVIRALNLRRPEWPEKLQRPIVLWVPDYLLAILGRQAPDFLDWRSDTLHFPPAPPDQLRPMQRIAWEGDDFRTMRAEERRKRVDELMARAATYRESQDPVVQAARAEWLLESARHLQSVFSLEEASRTCAEALAVFEYLQDSKGIVACCRELGRIRYSGSDFLGAKLLLKRALVIAREIGDRRGESDALKGLGHISVTLGETRRAVEYYNYALAIAREIGDRRREGGALMNLAKDYAAGRAVLDEMRRDGVPPNVVTYTTLINLAKDYAPGRAVLEEMRRDGVPPNVVTYTTLINLAKDYAAGRAVLEEMRRDGVPPNVVTYNTLFSKDMGDCSADEVLRWYLTQPSHPETPLGILITQYCRKERWDQALRIALDYPHNDVVTKLIRERTTEAIAYFEAAWNQDPNHPNATYALGIALMAAGRHSEAERCLRQAMQVAKSSSRKSDIQKRLASISGSS